MWLTGALGLAKRIPREAWLIAAAIAALWAWGNHREAQGRAEGRAEILAKFERETRKQADQLAAASVRYERLAQSIRAQERTDRETIREVYRNVQVPADCAVPDAAVRVLSEAVTRANAAAAGQSGG